MRNYVQDDGSVTLTVPSGGVVGGNGYLIGALFGVAAVDNATVGDSFVLNTEGVYDLPKAAVAVAEGVAVYWDNTAKVATTVSTSNKAIGHCAQLGGALSGDATVSVRLNTTVA